MRPALLFTIAAGMLGCAAPWQLVTARNAYHEARLGPASQLSADELAEARVHLDTANRAFTWQGDVQAVRDNAYLALKKVEIANARAQTMQNLNVAARLAAAQQVLVAVHIRAMQLEEMVANTTAEELPSEPADLAADEDVRRPVKFAKVAAPIVVIRREGDDEVVTFSSFDSGDDAIPALAQHGHLDQVAERIKQLPDGVRVTIEGFADTTGPDALNQELSERRATAVRDALVTRGVPAEKLEVEGRGTASPLIGDETPASHAANRRVEIRIPMAPPNVS